MYQFYFLSILCNIFAGSILAAEFVEERIPFFAAVNRDFLGKSEARMWLGGVTLVVGVFKLLSVTHGDLVLLGDILPAAAGILGGGTLLFEYFRDKSTANSRYADILENLLVKNRTVLGLFSLGAGVLHFFFPAVLFL